MNDVAEEALAARVLVVDDDPGLLRMMRLALVSEGLEVVTATDGAEALDRISAQSFDVVVLDLQMPRMDGRTFYREIRSRHNETPVVILSAYGAESARNELGAQGAINKPFDPFELIDTVTGLSRA